MDGVVDGQISDPRACSFDPSAAACLSGEVPTDGCLTAAEVEVARKFYEGPRDAEGHRFTIGGPQVGSELSWVGVYVPNGPNGRIMSPMAALPVIKYLAFPEPQETATVEGFRFDQATFTRLAALHPLYDATNTNLSPIEKAGGKLILYHGWSDPHISPLNSIAYYEGVEDLLGEERTRNFARLFLFPGLYHCGGGDGPAEFDILSPLMAWVEKGLAPGRIITGRPVGGEPPSGPPPMSELSSGPQGRPGPATADPFAARLNDRPAAADGGLMERTRPVYAYPAVARYDGRGSIEAAASFIAGPPLVPPHRPVEWAGKEFVKPYTPMP